MLQTHLRLVERLVMSGLYCGIARVVQIWIPTTINARLHRPTQWEPCSLGRQVPFLSTPIRPLFKDRSYTSLVDQIVRSCYFVHLILKKGGNMQNKQKVLHLSIHADSRHFGTTSQPL